MVEQQCEAVDLNLGCPQHIAKRGRYGSFLQDDWDLIHKMISTLHHQLAVPVTAKIRVFPSTTKTVEYAKMLVDAGAQLLTVHGRLREQKGHHTGLADWTKIKAVKDNIKIPVIANGNILYHDDVQHCLEQTGADGVMSAEGHLYNPAIFKYHTMPPVTYDIALEYLEICKQVNTRYVVIKSHLFKLFHTSLPMHTDLRDRLGVATCLNEMELITLELKERIEKQRQLAGPNEDTTSFISNNNIRQYAPWRCQVNFFFFMIMSYFFFILMVLCT
jgi:tRNA-dihydrouridine synthase 1